MRDRLGREDLGGVVMVEMPLDMHWKWSDNVIKSVLDSLKNEVRSISMMKESSSIIGKRRSTRGIKLVISG